MIVIDDTKECAITKVGPIDTWELGAVRREDGSLGISLTLNGEGLAVELTNDERLELAKAVGDAEGAGYFRAARKDKD